MIVPGAAESWIISEDGKNYRFNLRPGLVWSNGDSLNAGDFVSSIRRSLNPATANPNAALLYPIRNARAVNEGDLPPDALGVRSIDGNTLEILLEYPTPYFLNMLSHSVAYPVHRVQHDNPDSFASPGQLVGNGAYLLDAWSLHDRMTLKKNRYYRDADRVPIETVYYYPIDDENAEFNMFRSGQLDITDQIPNSHIAELLKNGDPSLRSMPYLSSYFYVFDLSQPPLDDPLIREALSLSIDRNVLVDFVTGAGERAAYSLVPAGIPGYSPASYAWQDWPVSRRLSRAATLYRQAGYSREKPLRVHLRFNNGENQRRIAVAVASMWSEALGVETELHGEEWRVFLSRRTDPDQWDVFRFGWVGDYADASNFLEIFSSQSAQNFGGYRNPQFDALLEASARDNGNDRSTQLARAEEALLASYAIAPLFFYVSKHLVSDRVNGFESNVLDHTYSRHLSLSATD